MQKIKLHLGCGSKRIENFINIDIRNLPNVDEINDIKKLINYKNNSIDLIYASHVLEHVNRCEYFEVIRRWYDILNFGGILRISVPDIEKVFEHYSKFKDLNKLRGFLWGGQNYSENYHYMGWDFQSLKSDLLKVGFSEVRRYDWRETEHSHIDDYSQCYLPHMDKDNGMLMSLNVEAIK